MIRTLFGARLWETETNFLGDFFKVQLLRRNRNQCREARERTEIWLEDFCQSELMILGCEFPIEEKRLLEN